MTDRLQEIRERMDTASAGPWANRDDWSQITALVRPSTKHLDPYIRTVATVSLPEDGEFIRRAPDDIAWLIGEVQMLRKMLKAYRDPDTLPPSPPYSSPIA